MLCGELTAKEGVSSTGGRNSLISYEIKNVITGWRNQAGVLSGSVLKIPPPFTTSRVRPAPITLATAGALWTKCCPGQKNLLVAHGWPMFLLVQGEPDESGPKMRTVCVGFIWWHAACGTAMAKLCPSPWTELQNVIQKKRSNRRDVWQI